MNRYLLSLLWILPSFAVFSQSGNNPCISPLSCSYDLRDTLFAKKDLDIKTYSYANLNGIPANFHDVAYQSSLSACTVANDCVRDTAILKYQVYYPSPRIYNYMNCRLPLALIFHAGSFADCNGAYDNSDMRVLCQSFAQRGFIAISVEYRSGTILVPGKYGNYYSVQQTLAMWRAGQDARGALRSIIKRERNGKEPYRIDTNNIFVVGKSSGALIAMNLAFYNKNAMLNNAFSKMDNASYLGAINQNYYYGSTSIDYSIKGVLDMWGAVLVPQTADSSYLKAPENFFFTAGNNMPPVIAFQGAKDKAFNYRYDVMTYPPATIANGLYSTESYCLNTASTFNPKTDFTPDGWMLGAQNIYEMYKRKNRAAELYIDCDMGHGLEINGDFGLPTHNTNDVNSYIVQRACTFFQAVVNGIADSLTTTKFVSCQNFRNQCSVADNNNNCHNGDDCSGKTLMMAEKSKPAKGTETMTLQKKTP